MCLLPAEWWRQEGGGDDLVLHLPLSARGSAVGLLLGYEEPTVFSTSAFEMQKPSCARSGYGLVDRRHETVDGGV
jgi:hypothetical protein